MLTPDTYFGPKLGDPRITDENRAHAQTLSDAVNAFLDDAMGAGVYGWWLCPNTGTIVSGSHTNGMPYGTGDGGFRWSDSATGAPLSAHKRADAVDVYDPHNLLDDYVSRFDGPNGSNTLLERFGLYREAPEKTLGWFHAQDTAPGSGRRTFQP